MPDTTVTVRPDATVSAGSWVTAGPSLQAVTSDDDDATYMHTTNGTAILGLGTLVLPALAVVKVVQPRVRAKRASAIVSFLNFRTYDGLTGNTGPNQRVALTDAIVTYTGAASTSRPAGVGLWDQAALDAVGVWILEPPYAVEADVYEVYLDVVYNQAPAVTVTGPSGTITDTSQPTVTWTYSDPEGDDQERYRIRVFAAAVYGAGGFDPETSAAAWDSGEVLSAATSVQVGAALPDATTYKAYVKAADVGSGGRYGAYDDGPTFTLTLNTPNVPVVLAPTPDTDNAWVLMGVNAFENVMTENQGSLETNTTGWAAGTNAGIARSTAQHAEGAASLAMTATADGSMAANTSTGLAAVTPNDAWGAVAGFRAATTGRQVRVDIRWRDSGSTIISTSTGVAVADDNAGFTESYCVAFAPNNAAYGEVIVNVIGALAGEVHYVDTIALRPTNPNLLTLNQANLETDLTGWAAGTNAAVGRSQATALVHSGLNSLAVTAVADGNMAAHTPTGLSALPARAGVGYVVLVQCRAVAVSRSANALVRFYDSSGAQIGADGDSTSPNITNIPGGWTRIVYTATSPGGTAFMSLHLQVLAPLAGEVHVFDEMSVAETVGSPAADAVWYPGQVAWSRGGLVGKKVEMQRSDDGGATWSAVRLSVGTALAVPAADPFALTADQTRTIVVDHEAPPGVTVLYRARSAATVAGLPIVGDWSYPMPATLTINDAWLKNPLDATMNATVCLEAPLESTSTESQAVGAPQGREEYVVSGGTVRGEVMALALWFETDAAWLAFEALRKAQTTVLLQTTYGDGTGATDQYYLRLGPDRTVTRMIADGTARQFRAVKVGARQARAPS